MAALIGVSPFSRSELSYMGVPLREKIYRLKMDVSLGITMVPEEKKKKDDKTKKVEKKKKDEKEKKE